MFAKIKQLLFGKAESKAVAKNRLHFVLVQDRAGLSPDEMAKFKSEMVAVIERYFVIDETGFDIAYKRNGDTTTLFINSPIVVRRQDALRHDVGARKARGPRKHRPDDEPSSSVDESSAPSAASEG